MEKFIQFKNCIYFAKYSLCNLKLSLITIEEQFFLFESQQEEFTLNNSDPNEIYEIFKNSYNQSTGQAWDYNTFLSRAYDWVFFGVKPTVKNDEKAGFVAVRFQRSGIIKLTGVAGNKRAILRGIDLLSSKNMPVWGGVSSDIADMAKRKGFIVVPKEVAQKIGPFIPNFATDSEGDVVANITGGIGVVKKVLIVNQNYLNWLQKNNPILFNQINNSGNELLNTTNA